MELGDKDSFVQEYIKGYLDGHDIELLNENEMNDKINQIQGYAEATFNMIQIMRANHENMERPALCNTQRSVPLHNR